MTRKRKMLSSKLIHSTINRKCIHNLLMQRINSNSKIISQNWKTEKRNAPMCFASNTSRRIIHAINVKCMMVIQPENV